MTIASEWPEPWRVDVLDRLLERVDDAHREHQGEELGVPVLVGRLAERRRPASPASARARPSTRSSTPCALQRAQRARQELGRRVGVDEQRLGGVADAGALAPWR